MLLFALIACTAEPAPERVEELVVYGFANFDAPDRIGGVVSPLSTWVDDHVEELAAGYVVDALSADDLVAAGLLDADVEGILGALGAATYQVDVHEVARATSSPKRTEIYEATTSYRIVSEEGDRDCFLAGDCPRYTFTADEVSTVPVLGDSERRLTTEYQWLEGHDDVLALRQLAPEPTVFSSPLMEVDQQYGFVLLEPLPGGGTRRTEAFWVDARFLGASAPEGFTVSQAVGRMQDSADQIDAWIQGTR